MRRSARRRLQHQLACLDVLRNPCRTGQVTFAFGDANTSALITMPERSDYKYVVMPMRI
jgi:DNA polymerase-3 subunit beta